MGGGAVELLVQRPMLVQHAVENIGCDPPCRETGHLGWHCKSLSGHGAEKSRKDRIARSVLPPMPLEGMTPVSCEYAKCKNRAAGDGRFFTAIPKRVGESVRDHDGGSDRNALVEI